MKWYFPLFIILLAPQQNVGAQCDLGLDSLVRDISICEGDSVSLCSKDSLTIWYSRSKKDTALGQYLNLTGVEDLIVRRLTRKADTAELVSNGNFVLGDTLFETSLQPWNYVNKLNDSYLVGPIYNGINVLHTSNLGGYNIVWSQKVAVQKNRWYRFSFQFARDYWTGSGIQRIPSFVYVDALALGDSYSLFGSNSWTVHSKEFYNSDKDSITITLFIDNYLRFFGGFSERADYMFTNFSLKETSYYYDTLAIRIKPQLLKPEIANSGHILYACKIDSLKYSWYMNDTLLPETGSFLKTDAKGHYKVCVERSGYCPNCSDYFTLTSEMLSQREITADDFLVYPNPASREVHVLSEHLSEVIILNTQGQIVYQSQTIGEEHSIHLEGWIPGIYLIKVSCAGEVSMRRLMVAR